MSNSSEDNKVDVRLDSIRMKNRITLDVSDTEIRNSYAFVYIFSSITNVNKTIHSTVKTILTGVEEILYIKHLNLKINY